MMGKVTYLQGARGGGSRDHLRSDCVETECCIKGAEDDEGDGEVVLVDSRGSGLWLDRRIDVELRCEDRRWSLKARTQ
jgi:hypothetical protein